MTEQPQNRDGAAFPWVAAIGIALALFWLVGVMAGGTPSPMLLGVGVLLLCTGLIIQAINRR